MRNTDKKRTTPAGNKAEGETQDEGQQTPSLRDLILSAGAALDGLDETQSPQEAEGESPAGEPAPSGKKRGGKKAPKRKVVDAPAEKIEWNESTAGLDFVETPEPSTDGAMPDSFDAATVEPSPEQAHGETQSDAQGDAQGPGSLAAASAEEIANAEETTIDDESPFEALARRIADTVATREDTPEGEVTEAEEFAADATSEALNAGLEAPAQDEHSQLSFDAEVSPENAAEAEPMGETSLDDIEEKIEAAENDADPEATVFVESSQLVSIIESLLFSTDKPVSVATMKVLFKGTNIRTKDIKAGIDTLAIEYASPSRGVVLEDVNGGYQLRTKSDNAEFLRRLSKVRPFKLSGPSLEVMAIVAYRQPITKHEIDELRGVESGHLLRALLDRGLIRFGEKSDLPGKPLTYLSTQKFLETFGLRNLRELPTLSEIDDLMPEGIEPEQDKETLADLTSRMSTELTSSYSEGEDELDKINEQLKAVDTTSEFFEQEKQRERDRRDHDRAQDIREKIVLGDEVETKDRRWLDRYEAKLAAPKGSEAPETTQETTQEATQETTHETTQETTHETTHETTAEEHHGKHISVDGAPTENGDLAGVLEALTETNKTKERFVDEDEAAFAAEEKLEAEDKEAADDLAAHQEWDDEDNV